MIDVPRSLDDITPGWLGRALCPEDPHSVDAIAVERLGEGAGFMSDLARVRIDTARPDLPASVVIKLPSSVPANREVAESFDSYRNECEFYRRFANRVPVRTPKVYVNQFSDAGFVLVLQDLADHVHVDQIEGASHRQTMVCMYRLARMHARFWNAPPAGLQRYADSVAVVADDYPRVLPLALDVIEKPSKAVGTWLHSFVGDYARHARSHLPGAQTLVHIDFRLDNLLFKHDDTDVVVIDWGDNCLGPPGFDVAHFLATCVPAENRRAWEAEAIATYHAALGPKVRRDYSLNACRRDYQRFLPCVFYIPALIAALEPENDRGRVLRRVAVDRGVAAIEDHLEAIRGLYA